MTHIDTADTTDIDRISPLQVLQSGAGYYIGTTCRQFDSEGRVTMEYPNSRNTGYFATEEAAEACLADIEAGDTRALRPHP